VTWVGPPPARNASEQPAGRRPPPALAWRQAKHWLLLLPLPAARSNALSGATLAAAAAELQRQRPGLRVIVRSGQAAFEAPLARPAASAGVRVRWVPAAAADRPAAGPLARRRLALQSQGL